MLNYRIFIPFLLLFVNAEFTTAQIYQLAHRTVTFNDPLRTGGFGSGAGSGRQIQCEIYYPSQVAGEETQIAPGTFPHVVFAHGLTTPIESYASYWESLVPFGYIFIVPRTEGTTLPVHLDFGLDLNQIGFKMANLSQVNSSPFFQSWNGKSAVIGHDMGAGCAILGGSSNSFVFDAFVAIAPTETNPSAVATAVNIEYPSLFVSGTADSVTNRVTTLLPMYNGLLSECRSLVEINGGGHCGFATNAISCDLNESSTSSGITISSSLQQSILLDYLNPWLNYFIKDICNGWIVFSDLSDSDNRTSAQTSCSISLPSIPIISQVNDVPMTDVVAPVQWYFNGQLLSGETASSLSISSSGAGNYQVVSLDTSGCSLFSDVFVVTEIIVGIEDEMKDSGILVYPNPSNQNVLVRLSNSEPFSVELLNLNGKIIQLSIQKQTEHLLDVSQFPAGLYFVRVNSKEVVKLSVY